ncbi:MAG TPA: DUF3105 domain-containing protein [Polyangiaceae bacterium]|nr:DUF3105 domain-containing protein [Polyangiaceae bacterium]
MKLRMGTLLVVALVQAACGSSEDGGDTSDGADVNDGGGSGGGSGTDDSGLGGSGLGGDYCGVDPDANVGEEPSQVGDCSPASGACGLVECAVPEAGADHAEPCTALEYASNPPTSGTHFSIWAAFANYQQPVPRGFLVHSLEHGAVVLSYNCAQAEAAGLDCAELRQQLTDFFDSWAADPLCSATRHRLLVTPDPELDAPFAAAAWGHYLKGTCFDADRVTEFVEAHYGQTYEDICNAGIDPATYPSCCGY